MKALRGILITLVIVLVVVVVTGVTFVGFNHSGQQSNSKVANSDNVNNNKNQTQSDKADTNGQSSDQTQDNNQQGNMNMSGMTSGNNESSGQVDQSVYGNPNGQMNMPQGPLVVAQAQIPPDEYLKKMQEAMGTIKEATGLMANAPYMASGTTSGPNQQMGGGSNGVAMDKIHEGIYKMAQGTTLMDQAMTGMQKEIEQAREKNISFYQIPSRNNQYYLYNPNAYGPYMNSYPQNNPYYYPNINQVNPNQNQQFPTSQSNTDQTQQHTGTSHGTATNLGFNFNLQSFTYLIYGFLVLSLIGVFIAVTGFIRSLFKPAQVVEQRGDSVVG